jgi:hypothetical protein
MERPSETETVRPTVRMTGFEKVTAQMAVCILLTDHMCL